MNSTIRQWGSRVALLFAMLLGACASDPPPIPPSELQPVAADVTLMRLWSAKVGKAERGHFEPWIDGEQMVLANRRGELTSLSTQTGMRQWTRDLDVKLSSGVGGSADQLYVSDIQGVIHALDPSNGEFRWQASASSEVLVPVSAGFGVAVARSVDGRVMALEPEDGSERWSVSNTPPALTLNGYSRPLVLDGGVLIGLDDGRLLAVNINTGKLIWETVISVPSGRSEVERLVDIDADILVDNQGIFVANYRGKAARVEPARGQIEWTQPLSAGSGIGLNDESLIVVDDTDTLHRLSKENGQIVWSADQLTGRELSPPAFTPDGDIIVGDFEGFLHVLDYESGEIIGRTRPAKGPVKARPVTREDTVFVQSTDGIVAAYRFAR